MPVHRRVTPSIKFAGTHLYIWVERGTVRVLKCLAQEHNIMSPGLEPGPLDLETSALNFEATAPPTKKLTGYLVKRSQRPEIIRFTTELRSNFGQTSLI